MHYRLATLKKGDTFIADYFHKFSTLITFDVVNQPLNDFELVLFLLVELDSK